MAGYSNHLIAFIDFLGFSEAMKDHDRADPILQLLAKLVAIQGDFWAQSEKLENGHRSIIRPAISAFSDNIVISYPLDSLTAHGLDDAVLVIFLQNLISFIAWNAFQSRLLIRGGVAIGPAYHAGGVVFGPAVIEAYETERSLAVYPRVALAPSITHGGGFDKWKGHTWQHDDGVQVLGYMTGFVTRTIISGGWGHTMVKSWVAEVRAAIAVEIARLSGAKDVRALSKWVWFQNNLESNLSRMPPEILAMDTPPVAPNPWAAIEGLGVGTHAVTARGMEPEAV